MHAASRFMKNDRVEFDLNSRTVHGVLVEDAETLKVVADGGKLRFTVPFARLRFSSKLLPKNPPHPMDAWQVAGFSELREVRSEAMAYTATITLDGVPSIAVSNPGSGSPDRLVPLNGDYATIIDFRGSVRNWLSDHGVDEGEIVDEESFWITYKARMAPYGVLVEEAIAERLDVSDACEDDEAAQSESLQMR